MAALPYAATGSAKAAHASQTGAVARSFFPQGTRSAITRDSHRTAQAEPSGSRRSASRPSSAWSGRDAPAPGSDLYCTPQPPHTTRRDRLYERVVHDPVISAIVPLMRMIPRPRRRRTRGALVSTRVAAAQTQPPTCLPVHIAARIRASPRGVGDARDRRRIMDPIPRPAWRGSTGAAPPARLPASPRTRDGETSHETAERYVSSLGESLSRDSLRWSHSTSTGSHCVADAVGRSRRSVRLPGPMRASRRVFTFWFFMVLFGFIYREFYVS